MHVLLIDTSLKIGFLYYIHTQNKQTLHYDYIFVMILLFTLHWLNSYQEKDQAYILIYEGRIFPC